VSERRDGWTLLYAILLALMFVGYPVLSSGLGAFDAYARAFSIVYRAFVVFASLALMRYALTRLPVDAWRGIAPLAFCVLWAMLLLRFAWDSSFVAIPFPLPWGDFFLMMVGAVFIPTVALFQAPSERAFDIARRVILCGGMFAGVFLLVAVIRLVIETASIDAFRRLGTAELNPISLGNVGVAVVTVAVLAQLPKPSTSRLAQIVDSRTVRWTAGGLGVFLAIASASKGPIVALLGVITLAQIGHIVRTGSVAALFTAGMRMILILLGMVALALALGIFFNVRVIDRFVDFAVDTSTSDRVGMMTRALMQFESSPWIGSAFVETKSRFYPHNLFVEVLMAIGIPGLLVVTVIILAGVRSAFRLLHTRHDWVALLWAQYQIGIMFTGSVYFSAEFWASIAAVLAADQLLVRQRGPSTGTAPPQPAARLVFGGSAR
jgi:hypothetical protein